MEIASEILHQQINDYSLFQKALTHSSYSSNNYEVLECLGDGYLKGIIINAIIDVFPNESEGFITEARFTLEDTDTLSELLESEFPDLIELIKIDQSIKEIDNKFNQVKEDVFEAFLGALILYNKNKLSLIVEYYKNIFIKKIKYMKENRIPFNINGIKQLTNYCNKNKLRKPIFNIKDRITKNGVKEFIAIVQVNNDSVEATGNTKKHAQNNAANEMLDKLIKKKSYKINQSIKNFVWFEKDK